MALLCLIHGACIPGDAPLFVVEDSAGVAIATNTLPPEGIASLRISGHPFLSIGAADGEEPYLFDQIASTRFLSTGEIAVADFRTNQVRIFDGLGTFVRSVGRTGDGPGELRGTAALWVLPGDTLAVHDFRGVSRFDSSGSFVMRTPLGLSLRGFPAFAIGMFANGGIIGASGTRPFRPDDRGLVQDTLELQIHDTEGAAVTGLGVVPSHQIWVDDRTGLRSDVPFTARPAWGSAANQFILADGVRPELRIWRSDGRLIRVVRWPSQERHVRRPDVERYVRDRVQNTQAQENVIRSFAARAPIPDLFPEVGAGGIVVSDAGDIWLPQYAPPWEDNVRWLRFSQQGQLNGSLELPGRFRPFDAKDNLLLGVFKNEWGLESVLVLRLAENH